MEGSVENSVEVSSVEGMLMERDAKKKMKVVAKMVVVRSRVDASAPVPKLLLHSTASPLLFIATIE